MALRPNLSIGLPLSVISYIPTYPLTVKIAYCSTSVNKKVSFFYRNFKNPTFLKPCCSTCILFTHRLLISNNYIMMKKDG
jgi:hypothetical protein